jgi:outer membrane protein
MKREMPKRVLLVIAWGLAVPLLGTAQPSVAPAPEVRWYERLANPYLPSTLAPSSLQNSPRVDSLLRAGNLYLSLDDAIALALENNLDVELQRYGPAIARSDIERAEGGAQALRGINYSVGQPPAGLGGPASPILNLPASGLSVSATVPTNLNELAGIVSSQASSQITTGTFSTGPAVPVFDPAIVGTMNWQHQSAPQTSTFLAGTNSLVTKNFVNTLGLQKGFGPGTQFGANFNSNVSDTNSIRNAYNPYTSSALGLSLAQPLLRGFGIKVNRRYIRMARNNEKISDLVFRQQVIETVAGVIRLYFDLASLNEDVGVKRQTLTLAQRLYEDNRNQVEQGTLAPIELVRAQAQIAAARQDLANSEGFARQQELIVKTVLTRRGTADPAIRNARIITTTGIDVPPQDQLRPIQDLIEDAWKNRPELESARLQIVNNQISLEGSRNGLRPELDLVAAAQNNGLAGTFNPAAATGLFATTPDPAFTGGIGTAMGQVFRRNFPTYGAGIQLNLPLRNRVAQGDYARDEINVRQTEIRLQQLINQVRLEVEGSYIALERARAAMDAAVEARKLQEQSLEMEMKKYANGLSTNFLVMQYQSFVAQTRSTEVAARDSYIKARTSLERAIGQTLDNHNVHLEDVYKGRVTTAPAALP